MLPAGGPARYWPRARSSALHRSAYESRLVPARIDLAQRVGADSPEVEEQPQLVAQVRPHHLGPVGRDRERDIAVRENGDGLAQSVLVGECARQQVRGRADLEHDARIAQLSDGVVVLRGE